MTFRYRPPHLLPASILSLGASGVLVVLLVGWLVIVLRRRRRSRADPEAGAATKPIAEDVPEPVG